MAPIAGPEDVTDLVDTSLSDTEIQPWLNFTARDINRVYDATDFSDEAHHADLETALTAFRIVSGSDRRPDTVSMGTSRVSYDTSEADFLRSLVRRLEPGSEFSVGGVNRDSDRHVRSANNPRDDRRITRADREPEEDIADAIDDTPYD